MNMYISETIKPKASKFSYYIHIYIPYTIVKLFKSLYTSPSVPLNGKKRLTSAILMFECSLGSYLRKYVYEGTDKASIRGYTTVKQTLL